MVAKSPARPSPNFQPPPVINPGPPLWTTFQPTWTDCPDCLPPTGQLQDMPQTENDKLLQWFTNATCILNPAHHPYPDVSTPYNTFQSKRLGDYVLDLALVEVCSAICVEQDEGVAWDLRLALTPLLPDVFANLARSHGLVDRINLKAKPAAGRPPPPPPASLDNSVIANVYPHYLGTVVVSHKNVRQGLETVLTYLLAELEPIVRTLHDHIMETHYECYASRGPALPVTQTEVSVDLDKVRAFVKEKDLYVIEHTLGFFDGPNGKVQTHCVLLGSGHRQLLIGFGTGTSKPSAEKAAFADAIANGRLPGYRG